MKRTTMAALIGKTGGIATIIGPALPWLSYAQSAPGGDPSFIPPEFENTSISGFSVDPFGLPFLGIALTVAAAWLWAGSEPRKAAALLGSISLAIGTLCAFVIIKRETTLFGGLSGLGAEVDLEFGVYVMLAGALAGLVATGIGAWPASPEADADASKAG